MNDATQGRYIIGKLKERPMTYRQMLSLYCGNSPWKRAKECLRPDEQIVKGKTAEGWTTWRVVKVVKA